MRARKYLTRELRCVIIKSVKRIDVLKGIEQILVQKAYETGHISHRADGDWQKQADGSWIPYKGQSNQSTPQTQESTENTEYGEITEEDLKGSNAPTPSDTIYSNEDKEKSVVNPKMDWDGISMSSVDKPAQYILENLEDFEGEDMDGTIKTFVKGAGNREQQIIDTIKRYIQRQAESDGKRLIWYSDGTYSIEKSAVRDMRSIPTTKNMGF